MFEKKYETFTPAHHKQSSRNAPFNIKLTFSGTTQRDENKYSDSFKIIEL